MAAWALQKAAYAVIGLDSVWLLSDTRGVKEKPTVGSEVIIRIRHNLLPARVLAIRDTGTYQVHPYPGNFRDKGVILTMVCNVVSCATMVISENSCFCYYIGYTNGRLFLQCSPDTNGAG